MITSSFIGDRRPLVCPERWHPCQMEQGERICSVSQAKLGTPRQITDLLLTGHHHSRQKYLRGLASTLQGYFWRRHDRTLSMQALKRCVHFRTLLAANFCQNICIGEWIFRTIKDMTSNVLYGSKSCLFNIRKIAIRPANDSVHRANSLWRGQAPVPPKHS